MRNILQFCLNRTLHKGLSRHFQKVSAVNNVIHSNPYFVRYQHDFHDTIKNGPGLKDFIISDGARVPASVEVESTPYIDESDLNGIGRKVYIEVQGCQMNSNDAEVVWAVLKKSGYSKTDSLNEADVALFVTCSIRDRAEAKIWERLNHIQYLRKKQHFKIGILGCMAERLKQKVLDIDKSVDLVAGPDAYKDLPRLLALTRNNQKAINVLLSLDETYADIMPVRLNENTKSAYVSIMRGCDNMCTYCIVPFTRGRERSRPMSSILDEVRALSDQGVKEVTLLGQNVNSYRDMSSAQTFNTIDKKTQLSSSGFKTVYKPKIGGTRFDILLDKVSEIDPEMRIRFTSPHPKDFPDEVLSLIKERKNICTSLHMPAQSGSSTVLERMRRGYTREAYIELVHHIRSIIPDVTLTSDIICGFCGETEEEHQDTLSLIREAKYHFIYMYPYSMREKTTAHRRLIDNVPEEVKKARANEVGALFRKVAGEIHQKHVGEIQLVLVDGVSRRSEDFWVSRNDGNIKVIIPKNEIPVSSESRNLRPIQEGDYVAVRINEAGSLVLKGVPLYHSSISSFNGEALSPFEFENDVNVRNII